MKKKFKIIIAATIIIFLLLVMYLIDSNQMKKNLPVIFSTWGKNYKPTPKPYSYTVIDRTEVCADALEFIGSDEYYDYYLPCIQSETIYIKYDNGFEETLKKALSEEHVTLNDLSEHINLIKEPRDYASENNISCNTKDFEMNLYTDKKMYKTTEKIKMWATLKYVGNKDKITVWHAGSVESDTYFNYFITDGKDFNVQSVTNLMAKTTTFDKNKLYHYDYQKTGGWDADAPDADFWEKFYKEKDLLLPKGEYTITAEGAFSLNSNMKNENLICELKIKVVE